MLKSKLNRIYHKIFSQKKLEKVDPSIAKISCQYWNYLFIGELYSPFVIAQDVFYHLEAKENENNKLNYNYFCGGCGGCY